MPGSGPALTALADRSATPVRVGELAPRRLPTAIEQGCYARGGDRARPRGGSDRGGARPAGRRHVRTAADPHRGCAPGPLPGADGVADRVAALAGTLATVAEPGGDHGDRDAAARRRVTVTGDRLLGGAGFSPGSPPRRRSSVGGYPVPADLLGPAVLLNVAVGWSFVGIGLVARRRRPESRSGALMCAVGFAWLLHAAGAVNAPARVRGGRGDEDAVLRGARAPAGHLPHGPHDDAAAAAAGRARLPAHRAARRRCTWRWWPRSGGCWSCPVNIVVIQPPPAAPAQATTTAAARRRARRDRAARRPARPAGRALAAGRQRAPAGARPGRVGRCGDRRHDGGAVQRGGRGCTAAGAGRARLVDRVGPRRLARRAAARSAARAARPGRGRAAARGLGIAAEVAAAPEQVRAAVAAALHDPDRRAGVPGSPNAAGSSTCTATPVEPGEGRGRAP